MTVRKLHAVLTALLLGTATAGAALVLAPAAQAATVSAHVGPLLKEAQSLAAAGAKAKCANDYNAGKFKDVIADGESLKKYNALDSQSQLIIAQAYYKGG